MSFFDFLKSREVSFFRKTAFYLFLFSVLSGILFLTGSVSQIFLLGLLAGSFSFAFIFLGINFRQISLIKKYLGIVQYLDLDPLDNFDAKNKYAQDLLFSGDINDDAYEVISYYRPLGLLGGDLYYQKRDSKGYYWFAVGDSSGHNIYSHLFSSMILMELNYLIANEDSPKGVNQKINSSLRQKKQYESMPLYASMSLLRADSQGNFTHYGQHPNMVVFRAEENRTEIVETGGSFIGLDSMIPEPDHPLKFKLNKGDILFTFTDGLYEQKNSENRYFGAKLFQFLAEEPKEDLGVLVSRLFCEVNLFTEGKISDDITLLIIRKK